MDLIAAAPSPRIPVWDASGQVLGSFPVHRIYCVGRNFADHAKEMGATVTDRNARGTPVFFSKPADAVVIDGHPAYPSATQQLHHEVELVVALGSDAPTGVLTPDAAMALVLGYAVGLDLTRRDLQATAKANRLPWDTAKGFDQSAPISAILRADAFGVIDHQTITLNVNGTRRQQATLDQMIWSVPEIVHALSTLFALRAGDLIFMGTPAGVGELHPGDAFHARIGDTLELRGTITPPVVPTTHP